VQQIELWRRLFLRKAGIFGLAIIFLSKPMASQQSFIGIFTGYIVANDDASIAIELNAGFLYGEWRVSFTIDGEGPFQMTKTVWVESDGRLMFTNDSFHMVLEPLPGSGRDSPFFKVTLLSAKNGRIGSGTLHYEANVNGLTIKHIWQGSWSGTWLNNMGQKTAIRIVLRPANVPTMNPPDLDLPFTQGKTGFIQVGTVKFPFSSVVLDHFRREIRMTYQEGDITLNLDGRLKNHNLKGTMTSSLRGNLGTFDVDQDSRPD
jgi:hypothetical protein